MELHLSESQSAGIYCLCLIHSSIVAKGGPRKGGGWSFYKPTRATQVLQSQAVRACKRIVLLLREKVGTGNPQSPMVLLSVIHAQSRNSAYPHLLTETTGI
ncbi:hypothetical protein QQF64_005160 [Cirrhinus molitorella]|uniref:Uncharacterized protein n=1 Tax=Cirrhinus molitorella TaxID=172907 RepID=A0ABR3MJL6_9TELE